jgi:hypothetical protein
MLSVGGVSCNEYAGVLGRDGKVPDVECPAPECGGRRQRGHGFYKRYVEGRLVEFRRLLCTICGVTNAILPADICAYRDAKLTAVEAAADAARGPAVRAVAAGQAGGQGRRRVRRWGVEEEAVGRWIIQILALLPAGPQTWLERVRAVVGKAGGALVRLRSWLWSRYRVYLGGPCGLYRLGRPRGCPAGQPQHTLVAPIGRQFLRASQPPRTEPGA